MTWWNGPLVGFDLETTAPDPFTARIVTAAVAVCEPGKIEKRTWLADPGVPIPQGASDVHGITTERARAEGRPADEVLGELLEHLGAVLAVGAPLVIANARYDCTVIDHEARRRGGTLGWLADVPVVDPFVLDKHLDRYRPSYIDPATGRKLDPEYAKTQGIKSSRTLEGMATHYGATLDGAHDAAFDAIAACRIAWRICAKGTVIRRRPHEARALEPAWQAARGDLRALHEYQRALALAERERFADYKRSVGDHEAADRIDLERGWPVLDQIECPEHGQTTPCSVCDDLAAANAESMTEDVG